MTMWKMIKALHDTFEHKPRVRVVMGGELGKMVITRNKGGGDDNIKNRKSNKRCA